MRRHLNLLKAALVNFLANGDMVLAGNMAFLGMLGVFPFIIFLVTLSGLFGQSEIGTEAIQFLFENLPNDIVFAIRGPIENIIAASSGGVLTVSVLFAIWTAASALEAGREAILHSYRVDRRPPFWQRRLESLGVILLAGIAGFTGMLIVILGPAATLAARAIVPTPDFVDNIWTWLRLGLTPSLLFLALLGLYLALSPRGAFVRKYHVPGAILALIVWIAAGAGMSYYLANFANYDLTYGSLAGVVVTQLFLYILSAGFILGSELNVAYARDYQAAG